MDPTLGNDTNIGNRICILAATWGDGTLLCPSSFTEEDAVNLCVGLGQEHPEGVLQLSDTETVLAFWCNSNIMATIHCLIAATVWQGEPIMLHILPLKGRQVRNYVTRRGSHPSGTQIHGKGREWIPSLSPACPAWLMGPRWN